MSVDFKKIRRVREKMGLGTSDAARKAGWTPQKWANMEAGRRKDLRVSTLLAVAKVLGCKVDDLLKGRR